MKELIDIVRARNARPDLPFALATVVRVTGSSYRKPGARMLVSLQGRVAGSVSGGCLERDVVTRARRIILGEPAALVVYDTTEHDDLAFGTSLGCEGRIEILLQPLAPDADWPLANEVEKTVRTRRPSAVATVYRAEDPRWLGQSWRADDVPADWRGPLAPIAAAVLTEKKPAQAHLEGGQLDLLVERLAPPTRLVIFGAGHDVPPLVRLAEEVGFHVTVVDRRADFADPARFPGATSVRQLRPSELGDIDDLLPDEAAAVIMNHHYATDAELLARLVARPLAYLGVLGPRRRTLKILREAAARGLTLTPRDLERLHAPVGLDLGAETPEQIALCILAELQAVLAGRPAVHLRTRSSLADDFFGQQVMAPTNPAASSGIREWRKSMPQTAEYRPLLPSAGMTGVILLAAGEANRMGRPKQLLPYGGSNLLRHAAQTAQATGLGPVVVVLGAEAAPCREALGGLDVHTVVNEDWPQGLGSSVRTGVEKLRRLAPACDGILILAHDQPAITAVRLRDLVAAWREGDLIVAARYDEIVGVPAYFRAELQEELARLTGARGARKLIEAHRARVRPFDLPEARFDLDTPTDYETFLQSEKAAAPPASEAKTGGARDGLD